MGKKKKKNYIVIKPDQCKGCKLCVESCPKGCIFIGKDINCIGYEYAQFDESKGCIGCGLCFYVCPEPGAISVYKDEEEGSDEEETDKRK